MEAYMPISIINDFIFCPLSIYFHNLFRTDDILFQDLPQIEGKQAHQSIDNSNYSSKKSVLQGIEIYSSRLNICGKIDLYDSEKKTLTERKKKIKTIYDGYIFQLYAQYFAMVEMGYEINALKLYSYDDNKSYPVDLPDEDPEMLKKFEDTIRAINEFDPNNYTPQNKEKCTMCIYNTLCDRTLVC